jgi:hypothetical protein
MKRYQLADYAQLVRGCVLSIVHNPSPAATRQQSHQVSRPLPKEREFAVELRCQFSKYTQFLPFSPCTAPIQCALPGQNL